MRASTVPRRRFLAALVGAAAVAPRIAVAARIRTRTIHLLAIVPRTEVALRRGIALGLTEAERTATLLGANVRLVLLDPTEPLPASDAPWSAVLALEPAPAASLRHVPLLVIGCDPLPVSTGDASAGRWLLSPPRLEALATLAAWLGGQHQATRWVFAHEEGLEPGTAEAERALQSAGVRLVGSLQLTASQLAQHHPALEEADVLFVHAGPQVLATARSTLAAGLPDGGWFASLAGCAGPLDGPAVRQEAWAVEWHHGFERYGASELNERFTKRFSAPMNGDAWRAWFAVRTATETALRAAEGGATIERLLLETRFDGHKGVALTFDRVTHRLRQPIGVAWRGRDSDTWQAWDGQ